MCITRSWKRLIAVLMMTLAACVPLKPYHAEEDKVANADGTTPPRAPASQANDSCSKDKKTCSLFVEYDDFGHLFSRAQLDEATDTAANVMQSNGIVIVYVHGWHHNANDGDTDLQSFHKAIEGIGKLDSDSYKDDRKIMGIYVGWRGESISLKPLNVLTFWDRKNTAHAVGDGAVFELFRKLANSREKYPKSRLVVVGHSFGAAVTYSSVAHSIMDQIIDDPYSEPASNGSTQDRRTRWDMVVLVNPAFEAMQVRPHFELARSRDYGAGQLPHLIIVTSEEDWATKTAFPAGRHLSTTFKKYADSVSPGMNTTAIGHYIPYITHQLTVNDKCGIGTKNISSVDKLGHVIDAKSYCFGDRRALQFDDDTKPTGKPVLLTRCDEAGDCAEVADDHYIRRGPSDEGKTPLKMPIMNIRTTGSIMNGHNDIWNPTMQGFLVQFLLLTVSKPISMPTVK